MLPTIIYECPLCGVWRTDVVALQIHYRYKHGEEIKEPEKTCRTLESKKRKGKR